MKKNDWVLAVAVGLYSFLFYQQTAGINFLIFNIVLIVCLWIKNNSIIKSSKWCFAATGCLFSSFCIAYYGNALAVTANIISLCLLSGLTLNSNASVIIAILFSCYSYVSSPVFIFLDRLEKNKNADASNTSFKRTLLIGIPVFVTLLFFIMYRSSSVLFNDFSKNIDFISFDWILFTLVGFVLLYGFFYHKRIKVLAHLETNISNELHPGNYKPLTVLGKTLNLEDEYFSGKIMFLLLNLLLLVVNSLDINFLFINNALPKGITYSEFVHQGTGMLIFSILIAIAIILFYFRGELNFYQNNKVIKWLAYIWILQNTFMLFSTVLRNNMYIDQYGLTYKRIGIYIYLFLCILGLVTVFVKILKVKSNGYLFRINGWLFYAALITAAFINWDIVITKFNMNTIKQVDKYYLAQLSDTNLPQLLSLANGVNNNPKNTSLKTEIGCDSCKSDQPPYRSLSFEEYIDKRLYYFLYNRNQLHWKSWYYDNSRIYNDILHMNDANHIKHLKLTGMKIVSLSVLKELNNISELDLAFNCINDPNELKGFPFLKKLNLRNNQLYNIKSIENLNYLEFLDISQNPISDYTPLFKLKKLKELHVGSHISIYQYELLLKNLPHTKVIKDKFL